MQRLHWGRAVSDKPKQMGPNESDCVAGRDQDGRQEKKKERKEKEESQVNFLYFGN